MQDNVNLCQTSSVKPPLPKIIPFPETVVTDAGLDAMTSKKDTDDTGPEGGQGFLMGVSGDHT